MEESSVDFPTDVSPRLIFRTKDKEFQSHPTSFQETPEKHPFQSKSSSSHVQLRHLNDTPVEALQRRESRKSVVSSPLLQSSDSEYVNEIAESSDYRESGLKKLKSRSLESIARWEKENEFLFALIEDESEWLTRLFPDDPVTPDNFFTALEDGVILCKLARLSQSFAEHFAKENSSKVPNFFFTIHAKNRCRGKFGQFMSRENVELFLKWCRVHKIPEPLLFESNDVVEKTEKDGMREGAREIVLCLMEVARLGVKYGVEPPQLILLEKEIEQEEMLDMDGSVSPLSVDSGVDTSELEHLQASIHGEERNDVTKNDVTTHRHHGDSKDTENNSNKEKLLKPARRKTSGSRSELHKVVTSILQNYNVGKITRLKEGKYIILGKVMFVRMLNDHCIVRIGGGWDTLEHYIMTHVGKAVPDSFEYDSGENSSPSLKRKSIPRKKSSARLGSSKDYITKSTPNLLLAVDLTEPPADVQQSVSKSGSSSPTLKSPSRSRDPYFFEKEQQRYDQRKISEAILKVQSDVVNNIKKSASLDWTHLFDKKDFPRKHSHSLTPGRFSLVMADIKIDQTDSSVPKITREPPTPKEEASNPLDSKTKSKTSKKTGLATKPKSAKAAPVVRQTATSAMRTSKTPASSTAKSADAKTPKSSKKSTDISKASKTPTTPRTPVMSRTTNKVQKTPTSKSVDEKSQSKPSKTATSYKNVQSRIDSGTRPTSAKKPGTPKSATLSGTAPKSNTPKSNSSPATKISSTKTTKTTKTVSKSSATASSKVETVKSATKTTKSKEAKPTAKVSPTKKVKQISNAESEEIVTLEKAEITHPPIITSETVEPKETIEPKETVERRETVELKETAELKESEELKETVELEETVNLKEIVTVPFASYENENDQLDDKQPITVTKTEAGHSIENTQHFSEKVDKIDSIEVNKSGNNFQEIIESENDHAADKTNTQDQEKLADDEIASNVVSQNSMQNDQDDLYCVTPLNDINPPITPSSDIGEPQPIISDSNHSAETKQENINVLIDENSTAELQSPNPTTDNYPSNEVTPISDDISTISNEITTISGEIAPSSDDITPSSDDSSPGPDDITPGPDDNTPGPDDITPGSQDATPDSNEITAISDPAICETGK